MINTYRSFEYKIKVAANVVGRQLNYFDRCVKTQVATVSGTLRGILKSLHLMYVVQYNLAV